MTSCVAEGVGTECEDGSFYVGTLEGEPRFMTSSDWQVMRTWDNDVGSSSPDPCFQCGDATVATHATDGRANTDSLRNYDPPDHPPQSSNLEYFNAARYCDELEDVHGHSDWYLPAAGGGASGAIPAPGSSELSLLWEMIVSVGENVDEIGSDNTLFWSSSEFIPIAALVQRFDTGGQFNDNKNFNHAVRCFRR